MQKTFTLLFTFILISAGLQAQTRYFKGQLQGSQEVPANASAATGVVIVRYNMETNQILLTADYRLLSGPVTGSHIHNQAAGSSGPIIVTLDNTGGVTGVLTGSATLTEPQELELLAGRMYANVHT